MYIMSIIFCLGGGRYIAGSNGNQTNGQMGDPFTGTSSSPYIIFIFIGLW